MRPPVFALASLALFAGTLVGVLALASPAPAPHVSHHATTQAPAPRSLGVDRAEPRAERVIGSLAASARVPRPDTDGDEAELARLLIEAPSAPRPDAPEGIATATSRTFGVTPSVSDLERRSD